MKKLLSALALAICSLSAPAAEFTASGKCEVFFSPKGGVTDAIVRYINTATTDIKVLAFYFTSDEVTAAVEAAAKRGVQVHIVLDRSQTTARGNKVAELVEAGAQVRIDSTHPIMHSKVIIIDSFTVLTGSFNFTASAEKRNAENVLICGNADQAKIYTDNWVGLWNKARELSDAPAPLKR